MLCKRLESNINFNRCGKLVFSCLIGCLTSREWYLSYIYIYIYMKRIGL